MTGIRELIRATKALADETRLRIIGLLLERECCVCEVMQVLQISQTRASRNLSILYEAELLTLRHEGLWSFYSLDWDGMPSHARELVVAVQKALSENPKVAADREKLRDAQRVGPEKVCLRRRPTARHSTFVH
jgi:ArsR family transcriptional regulator